MTRAFVAVLTAALCTLVASHVRADTRVIVHDFYGPNAQRVRDDVVNLLERQSGVTIIAQGQIERAAEKLGVDPYSPQGRIALGRELQLSAWMTGVVKKRAGQLKLTVVVFDGVQHTPVSRTRLSGSSPSNLSAKIKGQLWRKSRWAILRTGLGDSAVSPVVASDAAKTDLPKNAGQTTTSGAESAPATPSTDSAPATLNTDDEPEELALASDVADDLDEDFDESTGPSGELLRAFLGLGSPYRNLAYRSPVTSTLGDFQLSGAPMLDLNVAFHPARPFTDGVASWFALEVRGQLALSTPTVDREGNQFNSSYAAYHVGLRARVPVGHHYVSAFSGYAMSSFSISAQNKDVSSPTPSVDYRMIRTGAGAEFAFSDSFMLGLDAAWLSFLEVGDIGRWFPRASAGGFEVAMSATYSLTQGIFARAAASYQRAFFDFNGQPNDKYRAAGATDQYLAMSLGAGLRL